MLLVHGWMFHSDLNWGRTYAPLAEAGYRVLAADLRGHGQGLRGGRRFRLLDCAEDEAAILEALGIEEALVVGYSMGGPVTQLLARTHPERVRGFVLCATALEWQSLAHRIAWAGMHWLHLGTWLFGRRWWAQVVRLSQIPAGERPWVVDELSRGDAGDIAEAGRELGRFNSSSWAGELTQPRAVILTSQDRLVPPRKQHALARALGVEPRVLNADHDACARNAEAFNAALLEALRALEEG